MTSSARFAVYLVPPRESRLWDLGCRWLGRDPEAGHACERPEVPGCSREKLRQLTASPRLYGFHATMKAPFRLIGGVDETGLVQATARLAGSLAGFSMPALKVDRLDGFIALRPAASGEQLAMLERRCMMDLDGLRAPLEEHERARRLQSGLSPNQRQLLERWGYPYVLDEFRFHMTLTGRLGDADAALLLPWLVGKFGEVLEGAGAEIAIFRQEAEGKEFTLRRRFPIGS